MFQSPICGSQTKLRWWQESRLSWVSIPYMRVTNLLHQKRRANGYPCFNPLYAGHKRPWKKQKQLQERYVSIPYMRVTNNAIRESEVEPDEVSIPYMRVTNYFWQVHWVYRRGGFQSPICGSQTRLRDWVSMSRICFNPLYAGHKRTIDYPTELSREVSIPYMRVTNAPIKKIYGTLTTFQSPICGSQTS